MTGRIKIETMLSSTPAAVRRRMLEDRSNLAPGAAAVVGRFFAAIHARREPMDAPGPASFRDAAGSESTLATLLRTLAKYAPETSTAAGRELRQQHYAERSKAGSTARPSSPADPTETWPPEWRQLYPALAASDLAESSRRRHVASISRCAALVAEDRAGPDFTFYEAWRLARAFEEIVRPKTTAGYLGGLIALGHHGGLPDEQLKGLRYMRDTMLSRARQGEKLKQARICAIFEKGGFDWIVERVAEMSERATALPDHAAEKALLRIRIALCLLHMNKPARTGDVSNWVIGRELLRAPDGNWSLSWQQGKTRHLTEAGQLWPEVCEALDAHILGGRPDRFIHLRYAELCGANWLTLSGRKPPARWPSEKIKEAIGLPSHDLRTLAADYLRMTDPDTAPAIISTLLGHATRAAGDEYRALSQADAATQAWQKIRTRIASAGGGAAAE